MKYKPNAGRGDGGFTDIYRRRVRKDSALILLNALIDEINALIGVVRSKNRKLSGVLKRIQVLNSKISANIAGYISDNDTEELLKEIEDIFDNYRDIEVKEFIFFGKNEISAYLNLIRSKIRICEILAWEIKKRKAAVCLNRLSDVFFTLAVEYNR